MDWALVGRIVFWGIIGGLTAIQTAGGLPKNAVEWTGLCLAVLWAGYGKGSTKTEMFALNRQTWTEEQRRAAAGLPPKFLPK